MEKTIERKNEMSLTPLVRMLRSTGKSCQKRNASGLFGALNYTTAGNDSYWAIVA